MCNVESWYDDACNAIIIMHISGRLFISHTIYIFSSLSIIIFMFLIASVVADYSIDMVVGERCVLVLIKNIFSIGNVIGNLFEHLILLKR